MILVLIRCHMWMQDHISTVVAIARQGISAAHRFVCHVRQFTFVATFFPFTSFTCGELSLVGLALQLVD